MSDNVNHPAHYGGESNPFEVIKVIEDLQSSYGIREVRFGFCLGNAIKYIARAKKKNAELEDLKKAAWYLRRLASAYGHQLSSVHGVFFMRYDFSEVCDAWELDHELRDVFIRIVEAKFATAAATLEARVSLAGGV
jgi:hypothetical protein